MANYIVIDKRSNLITNVVASSHNISSTPSLKVVSVGDRTLDQYYKLKARADKAGELVDAGALAMKSPHFKEQLTAIK